MIDRIIFVGLHNKPYMSPLDSGTKTGKLIDRIINELPKGLEIVKSNILNTESLDLPRIFELANEWHWTYLPTEDDIIILLGNMTQRIHKENVRQVGNIINVAHPASKRSHQQMNKYVTNTVNKICDEIFKMQNSYLKNNPNI